MSDISNGILDRVDDVPDDVPDDETGFVRALDPEFQFEKNYDVAKDDEPWFEKLRLVFWAQHQTSIAIGLMVCLIGMTSIFAIHSWRNQGLIDIDDAAGFEAEFKVDINSAELGEIIILPGVGRKLAQSIIQRRESVGGFRSLYELTDVHGIGEKRLQSLRPFLHPIERGEQESRR